MTINEHLRHEDLMHKGRIVGVARPVEQSVLGCLVWRWDGVGPRLPAGSFKVMCGGGGGAGAVYPHTLAGTATHHIQSS